jgi:hypothetical protein
MHLSFVFHISVLQNKRHNAKTTNWVHSSSCTQAHPSFLQDGLTVTWSSSPSEDSRFCPTTRIQKNIHVDKLLLPRYRVVMIGLTCRSGGTTDSDRFVLSSSVYVFFIMSPACWSCDSKDAVVVVTVVVMLQVRLAWWWCFVWSHLVAGMSAAVYARHERPRTIVSRACTPAMPFYPRKDLRTSPLCLRHRRVLISDKHPNCSFVVIDTVNLI